MSMPANASADAAASQPTVGQAVLENGLQLAWEEDRRQPIVAIEVRIGGGLRGEGRYLGTGITHFIEHMLFKGTPTRPPGTIDQEVRRYGGTINAFTSFDQTGVSLFVESRHLKDALAMLADILQHAVFEEKEFEKERAVIISEIQMNLDDPDRRIHHLFWNRHYLVHPYRHPILGYQPLLERLTVQDLREFYASEYQPQNITIACAGDLAGGELKRLATELLGGWPRGATNPLQLTVPAEPPAVSAKQASVELPVQAAYVLLGFSSVRLADPDLYALDVLSNILGHGRSSRLYETVVRTQRLAHAVSAWNYTPADPGVFGIHFQTDREKIEPASAAVLDVIRQIQRGGVTEAELGKAKRSISADYLFGLQTVEGKAGDLATSFASTGDPLFTRQYVKNIERVTARQVRAAAQRYCDASKMTTAVIRPAAEAAAPAPAAEPPAPVSTARHRLSNGATAVIGVDRTLPIAAIVVAFRGGVRVETEATQGLSNLVTQLLAKGTARRTALDIATAVDSLGASLEPFSGRDGFGLLLQLLAKDLPKGMELMHELVTQSTFPQPELEIQRSLIAKQLDARDDEIFQVGGRLLRRQLFGVHPYRFDPLGERSTLEALTREQCLAFAKQWLTPSNMVISVFGDLDPDQVKRRLERSFGAMPAAPSSWPQRLPAAALDGVRAASQRMEKEQALVMLGFLGSTHGAADRRALDVVTAILSGMSGRLFQSVRERHGLSYTLGALHVPGWDPGYLLVYAATRPQEQEQVLRVLGEQLELAARRGFTEEEVEQAKRYLIGSNRVELQHLVGLAKRSALDELFGLGFDAWRTYEDQIAAITVPMANAAAQQYLTMPRRAEVLIGPNGHHRE
jgi:zinc protease